MDRPISVEEAREHLPELVHGLADGDSYVLTDAGAPIAKLVPIAKEVPQAEKLRRQAERIERAMRRLDQQPIRYVRPWKREDLYD